MGWLDSFNKNPTPQDMALIRAGAAMMQASANRGFGASVGAGLGAGLDEYSRGMKMAEDSRHRKALEDFRQRQLDIGAASAASTESYHNKSLEQSRELKERELELQKLRDEANRKRILAESGLAGARTEQIMQEVERLRNLLEDAEAKDKLDKELKKLEAQEPGFLSRLFAPRQVQQTPLSQRRPEDLTTQEMAQLATETQQQEAEQQRQLEQVMRAFKNKQDEKPIREMLQFMISPGGFEPSAPSLPGMMQRYK